MTSNEYSANEHNITTKISSKFGIQLEKMQKEEYLHIPELDMSFATERQCNELDIYNELLYKKSYKLYQNIMNKLKGSNLELKQSPQLPPNPNNLQRLFNYRQRNQNTNCLKQSAAILYLLDKGYKLIIRNSHINNASQSDDKLFESYQAIELATNLASTRNENYLHFIQILCDKNIATDNTFICGKQDAHPTTNLAPTINPNCNRFITPLTPSAPPLDEYNTEYNNRQNQTYQQAYSQAYTMIYPYPNDYPSLEPNIEPDIMQNTTYEIYN